PSIGAGYKGVFLDGYTETGASSNLTIETRDVHFLLANTQVDMIADFKTATGQTISFRPYIGIEGSFAIGTNTATASLSGASSSFNTGGDRNILRGYVGANFAKAIDETTKLFGGAEVSYNTSETTAFNVRLGLSKTF
ncbi:unnamed protein product, partial [Ectocarpus sp. 8 AP-2014]